MLWDIPTIDHFKNVMEQHNIPVPIGIAIPEADWDALCDRFGVVGEQLTVLGIELYKGSLEQAWEREFLLNGE